MKIKGILNIFECAPDRAGNSYHAFQFHDTETGMMAEGRVGGTSSQNLRGVPHEMGLKAGECVTITSTFPIRKFEAMWKGAEYAGCTPESIVSFIHKKFYPHGG